MTRTLDRARVYEFTIWKPSAKIGQLLLYKGLIPATPGFEDLTPDRVDLTLVSGQNSLDVLQFATRSGIQFEFYLPSVVAAKVAERRGGA